MSEEPPVEEPSLPDESRQQQPEPGNAAASERDPDGDEPIEPAQEGSAGWVRA